MNRRPAEFIRVYPRACDLEAPMPVVREVAIQAVPRQRDREMQVCKTVQTADEGLVKQSSKEAGKRGRSHWGC